MQVPNGTEPGIRRSKRPLLASRTCCNVLWKLQLQYVFSLLNNESIKFTNVAIPLISPFKWHQDQQLPCYSDFIELYFHRRQSYSQTHLVKGRHGHRSLFSFKSLLRLTSNRTMPCLSNTFPETQVGALYFVIQQENWSHIKDKSFPSLGIIKHSKDEFSQHSVSFQSILLVWTCQQYIELILIFPLFVKIGNVLRRE